MSLDDRIMNREAILIITKNDKKYSLNDAARLIFNIIFPNEQFSDDLESPTGTEKGYEGRDYEGLEYGVRGVKLSIYSACPVESSPQPCDEFLVEINSIYIEEARKKIDASGKFSVRKENYFVLITRYEEHPCNHTACLTNMLEDQPEFSQYSPIKNKRKGTYSSNQKLRWKVWAESEDGKTELFSIITLGPNEDVPQGHPIEVLDRMFLVYTSPDYKEPIRKVLAEYQS